jgi:hypothetical protein
MLDVQQSIDQGAAEYHYGASMSEMIERMARLMCMQDGGTPDRVAFVGMPEYAPRSLTFVPNEDWNKPRPSWEFYIPLARTALDAMRDPTATMCEASLKQDYAEADKFGSYAGPIERWNAMIDAVLKD